MAWQLSIILGLALLTTHSLFLKTKANFFTEHALVCTAVIYSLTIFPVGISYGLYRGETLFDYSPEIWILFGVVGLVFTVFNFLEIKSLAKIQLSQYVVLSNFRVVATALVSGIFFDQIIQFWQWFGVALVVGASIVMVLPDINLKSAKIDRFSWLALIGALSLGLGLSIEGRILDEISIADYLFFGWAAQTIGSVLAGAPRIRKASEEIFNRRTLGALFIIGCLRVGIGVSIIYSISKSENAALISAILSAATVTSVLGAYVFLKERDHFTVKIVGTVMSVCGVVILLA